MITTRRRLEYAAGFIELGMLTDAARELDQVPSVDRDSSPVTHLRLDLFMAAKDWSSMVELARALAAAHPDEEKGWIYHAYALRELSRITEAQTVLLQAELLLGTHCGVLHYNLACYACLLGNKTEAHRRLNQAAALDKSWLESAIDDPDLASLRGELRDRKS